MGRCIDCGFHFNGVGHLCYSCKHNRILRAERERESREFERRQRQREREEKEEERRQAREEQRLEKQRERERIETERKAIALEKAQQKDFLQKQKNLYESAKLECKYCKKHYTFSASRCYYEYCSKKCIIDDIGTKAANDYLKPENTKNIVDDNIKRNLSLNTEIGVQQAIIWSEAHGYSPSLEILEEFAIASYHCSHCLNGISILNTETALDQAIFSGSKKALQFLSNNEDIYSFLEYLYKYKDKLNSQIPLNDIIIQKFSDEINEDNYLQITKKIKDIQELIINYEEFEKQLEKEFEEYLKILIHHYDLATFIKKYPSIYFSFLCEEEIDEDIIHKTLSLDPLHTLFIREDFETYKNISYQGILLIIKTWDKAYKNAINKLESTYKNLNFSEQITEVLSKNMLAFSLLFENLSNCYRYVVETNVIFKENNNNMNHFFLVKSNNCINAKITVQTNIEIILQICKGLLEIIKLIQNELESEEQFNKVINDLSTLHNIHGIEQFPLLDKNISNIKKQVENEKILFLQLNNEFELIQQISPVSLEQYNTIINSLNVLSQNKKLYSFSKFRQKIIDKQIFYINKKNIYCLRTIKNIKLIGYTLIIIGLIICVLGLFFSLPMILIGFSIPFIVCIICEFLEKKFH